MVNYINTIDLDNSDKHNLETIIAKIKSKPCCASIQYKDSSSKGYHILLTCRLHCDLCRLVFDDVRRYELDQTRPIKFRNTLFDEKEYFGKRKVSPLCDRCLKFSLQTQLQEKEISRQEIVEFVRVKKITLPFMPMLSKNAIISIVHLGYTYYECPKCGWGKFVNNKKSQLNSGKSTQ